MYMYHLYLLRQATGGGGRGGGPQRHVPREQVVEQGDPEPQDENQGYAGSECTTRIKAMQVVSVPRGSRLCR